MRKVGMRSFFAVSIIIVTAGFYDIKVMHRLQTLATGSDLPTVLEVSNATTPEQTSFCDAASNQLLTLIGQNFLVADTLTPTVDIVNPSGTIIFRAKSTAADCTSIEGIRTLPTLQCHAIAIAIPNNALPPGTYKVRVTNPADAGLQSEQRITVSQVDCCRS